MSLRIVRIAWMTVLLVAGAAAGSPGDARRPPTPEQVRERLGPSAIDLPGVVRYTVTRVRTLADGTTQRWVERHARTADAASVEVLEPMRFGYKREGGRVWQMGGDGVWQESVPGKPQPMPPPVASGPSTGTGATSVRTTVSGTVILVLPWGGGETEEWEVDWGRRTVTGRRRLAAGGAVRWEEKREEERRDGVRWLRRVVREDRSGGKWNYTETWSWEGGGGEAPVLSASPGRTPQ